METKNKEKETPKLKIFSFFSGCGILDLGFENAEFEIHEIEMNPGDIIYTYTDGITEATNINDQMYGEQRLYDCLNNINETDIMGIAQKVKTSIK